MFRVSGSIFPIKPASHLKRLCGCLGLLLAMLVGFSTQPIAAAQSKSQSNGKLQIYFVDVEGGQATLFVTPDGHSLLIDTGWAGHNNRDADRIAAAAKRAGLDHLDYVLLTHYHGDHIGGVPQLVATVPVGTFIDHGPDREVAPVPGWQGTKANYDAYQAVLATGKYKHITLHAGEKLPLKDIDGTVVSADGTTISKPLPGAGAANPTCGDADKDPTVSRTQT